MEVRRGLCRVLCDVNVTVHCVRYSFALNMEDVLIWPITQCAEMEPVHYGRNAIASAHELTHMDKATLTLNTGDKSKASRLRRVVKASGV